MRAILPSRIGKTSTPSHSIATPSGRVAVAVHSLTAKSSADIEAAAPEAEARPALEDPADVRPHRLGALDALAGGVVLEDDVVGVERAERVEILAVPGRVVGLDQRARRVAHGRILEENAEGRPSAPFRSVTPGRGALRRLATHCSRAEGHWISFSAFSAAARIFIGNVGTKISFGPYFLSPTVSTQKISFRSSVAFGLDGGTMM